MSQENVDMVRRAFDAFTRGDPEAVLRMCAEDIVITQAPEVPGISPQQFGHSGVLEAFAIWPSSGTTTARSSCEWSLIPVTT